MRKFVQLVHYTSHQLGLCLPFWRRVEDESCLSREVPGAGGGGGGEGENDRKPVAGAGEGRDEDQAEGQRSRRLLRGDQKAA